MKCSDCSDCSECSKKITMLLRIMSTCKCGKICCKIHRLPEDHGCEFDYKSCHTDALILANPVVVAKKLRNQI